MAVDIESLYGYDRELILELLLDEYEARLEGPLKTLPLIIYDIPELVKTELMDELRRRAAEINGGVEPQIYVIKGGQITREYLTPLDKSGAVKVYDRFKHILPVYCPADYPEDPKGVVGNFISNGGTYNPKTKTATNGPGGFIFIEEYTNMSPIGNAYFWGVPYSRTFLGMGNIRIGSRWVFLCSANSESDNVAWDAYNRTRYAIARYAETPEDSEG